MIKASNKLSDYSLLIQLENQVNNMQIFLCALPRSTFTYPHCMDFSQLDPCQGCGIPSGPPSIGALAPWGLLCSRLSPYSRYWISLTLPQVPQIEHEFSLRSRTHWNFLIVTCLLAIHPPCGVACAKYIAPTTVTDLNSTDETQQQSGKASVFSPTEGKVYNQKVVVTLV